MILVISCWQYSIQNAHAHNGGNAYLQIISYLDDFVLYAFLDASSEPPHHYCPQNHTQNSYWLALDVSTSSQCLAVTTH
jgi:hypothetical protein